MSNLGLDPSSISDNTTPSGVSSSIMQLNIDDGLIQPLQVQFNSQNCTNNGSSDNESTSIGSASTIFTSRSNTPTPLPSKTGKGKGSHFSGKKRKRANAGAKGKGSLKRNYEYICMAKENHGQPIFGCQFNHVLKAGEPLILATVGSNRISIYECLPEGQLKLLYVFADPDSEEIFYCCAWTDDGQGKPLLAAAGARGIVRVISPSLAICVRHCLGHGNAINDLLFHPKDPNLLLSASKDHTLRLWNIKTGNCVAIFGGVEGHRDEVLAADIDITGSRIVSSGMDHSLKVWKLKKPEIENAVAISYTYDPKSSRPFPTVRQNFPDFSTRDVHRNYVDCTKWIGEFILSKSCENTVVCWKAGKTFQKWDELTSMTSDTTFIFRLDVDDCEIWFIRFSLDYWRKTLALGNQTGKTYVYDLSATDISTIKSSILSHPKCNSAIRQTALSRDGRVLICVCDDGSIWRWDISHEESDHEGN